jgi:hypothetical protein
LLSHAVPGVIGILRLSVARGNRGFLRANESRFLTPDSKQRQLDDAEKYFQNNNLNLLL